MGNDNKSGGTKQGFEEAPASPRTGDAVKELQDEVAAVKEENNALRVRLDTMQDALTSYFVDNGMNKVAARLVGQKVAPAKPAKK